MQTWHYTFGPHAPQTQVLCGFLNRPTAATVEDGFCSASTRNRTNLRRRSDGDTIAPMDSRGGVLDGEICNWREGRQCSRRQSRVASPWRSRAPPAHWPTNPMPICQIKSRLLQCLTDQCSSAHHGQRSAAQSCTECQAIPSLTYGRNPAARGSPVSKALPSR
jgi:hypothetical protein